MSAVDRKDGADEGAALTERGWHFPVELDAQGGIRLVSGSTLIRESVLLILGTAPGERAGRPSFGCAIHDLLFAPNDANTAGLAAHYCRQALSRWEPRIESVEVTAASSKEHPNRLLINIGYRVRATATIDGLLFPFNLRVEATT